ncbi:MAG: response regulator [Nitrospirae bacterium]|nr:response regulator [Nitrospirota bacterium]
MESLRLMTDKTAFAQDAQSGLYARSAFEAVYDAHTRVITAGKQGLALALISIDQYESIHQTFGQPGWNQVVELMGRLILTALQAERFAFSPDRHVAARYGENQFIVLLSEPSCSGADELAAQIRHAIQNANEAGVLPIALSVSVGLAEGCNHPQENLPALAEASLDFEIARKKAAGVTGTTATESVRSSTAGDAPQSLIENGNTEAVILVVDDEPGIPFLIRDFLSDTGAAILTSEQGDEALHLIGEQQVDLVLIDILLPGLNGIELLKRIRGIDPAIAVIMVTGSRDLSLAIEAIRGGADDYLIKPFGCENLRDSVSRGLTKRQLILSGKAYQTTLEGQVQQRTSELQQVVRHLENTYRATLKALGAALDTRDIETHAHSERVAQYALTLGRILNMGSPDLTTLERGVYLHDIGKIGIPDCVLLKQDKLDGEEWKIMRQHPQLGYRLASRVDFLKGASKIILAHHERFDGQGYPNGLQGEAIPIGARVFAVVDALDAITSHRPYRKAQSFEKARGEILRYSGQQFDPAIVEAFLSVPQATWSNIREEVQQQTLDAAEDQIPFKNPLSAPSL